MMILHYFVHIISYWLSVFYFREYLVKGNLKSKDILLNVVLNQILTLLWYPVIYLIGIKFFSGFMYLIFELCEFIVLNSTIFGILHLLVHKIKFLKWIHKQHHRMVIPIPLGAFYGHPLEHLLVNINSIVLTLYICNRFLLEISYIGFIIFTVLASFYTVSGHRYNTKHALHHSKSNVNYSNTPYILDMIIGTYKNNI